MQLISVSSKSLAAIWAELINNGGSDCGCYIGRDREVIIRLERDRAIYVRRKGVRPDAGSSRAKAWATELATFHKHALQAGLCLEPGWADAPCEAGWYAARCQVNHQQVLAVAGEEENSNGR